MTRLARLLVDPARGAVDATDIREAEDLLREACSVCPRQIFIWEELVQFLAERGRLGDAEACARSISSVETSPHALQRSDRILSYVLWHRARRAEDNGDLAGAATYLEQAGALLEKIGEKRDLAHVLESQALLMLRERRDADAVRQMRAALQGLKPKEDADHRARTLGRLVLVSLAAGDDADALLEELRVARVLERTSAALTEVARLARDVDFRPDIRRRLHLNLYRRAESERGTPSSHDLARAQLELFSQPPRRAPPIVSLVTELAVEFSADRFKPDGETKLRLHAEALRRSLSTHYGIQLPQVRLRLGTYEWLAEYGYLLLVRENTVFNGELRQHSDLYMGPVHAIREAGIPHTAQTAPGSAGEAAWVPQVDGKKVEALGLKHVAPREILIRHLGAVIEANLSRLIGWEEVYRLIEQHGLSAGIVAQRSAAETVGALVRVVAALLAERISVRAFPVIFDAVVRALAAGRPFEAALDELRRHPLVSPQPWLGTDLLADLDLSSREEATAERSRSAGDLPRPQQQSRTVVPAAEARAAAVTLTVRVELREQSGASDEAWRRAFRRRLTQRADDLVNRLKLPARCRIEVIPVPKLPSGVPHTIAVEDRACRVRRTARGDTKLDPSAAAEDTFATLFRNRDVLATGSVVRSIAADPRLSRAKAEALARPLLHCSLWHGIAVDRLLERWPAIVGGTDDEPFNSHALEQLVAELAAPELPVHITRRWYDALTKRERPKHSAGADGEWQDWLGGVRKNIFWELGFWVPPLTLHIDPGVGEHEMALQLNDAPMPVRRTFEAEDQRQVFESAILEEVRPVAACLLDVRTIEQILADLNDERFYPRLVAGLLEEMDTCTILAALRELVRERCSIRDQRVIIEALLASRDPWCRQAASAKGKPSVDQRVRSLRSALAPQLTRQHAGLARSVPAFVLDPELAARIGGSVAPPLSDQERLRLLDGITMAMDKLVPVGNPPVVLTDPESRPHVRRLIEAEFPDLPVLAKQDLMPELRLQRLANLAISKG